MRRVSDILLTVQRIPAYFDDPSIPEQLPAQLLPLLLNSNAFGHATRLDYGTGHELAFMLGIWCCVVSGWVGGEEKEDEEDEMTLRVFARWVTLFLEAVEADLQIPGSGNVVAVNIQT